MSKLDEVVDIIRSTAGADFAFVLTRRGRLVTTDAPPDMPESGRMRLVRAARPLIGTSQTAQLTLPRQDLVPYGGAAPVDVYLAVAAEQAVLCVVMATWADKRPVVPAIQNGLEGLVPLLDRKPSSVVPKAKERPTGAPPPARAPSRNTAAPKPRRRTAMTGLVGLSGGVATPSSALEQPPVIQDAPRGARGRTESLPDIVVGEATLGRESLAAIEREAQSSIPDISIHEASLGQDSLVAIDVESRVPVTSAPDVRVELASMSQKSHFDIVEEETANEAAERWRPDPLSAPEQRGTKPWVESPFDSKRNADAAIGNRRVAAPRVTLKLEELDEDILEAVLVDELEDDASISGKPSDPDITLVRTDKSAAAKGVPPPAGDPTRPPQASYDAWHDAVEEVTKEFKVPKRKT